MQGPVLLPTELLYCESFETEEALFQALTQKPADLVTFFEFACADETWCEEHFKLIRLFLRWGAKAYFLNQLSFYYAQRMVKTVQSHYAILKSLLFFKSALFFIVILTIEGQKIIINSLMFGVSSPFFTELFKVNCFNHMRNEWTLNSISFSLFKLLEEHILRGQIEDLWKHTYAEVLALMRQAKKWQLLSLEKECAVILNRYLNEDNILKTLLQAHQQLFLDWKQNCYEFFNKQNKGIRFLAEQERDLRVEFLDFKQDTLEIFDTIAPWVTHLTFSEYLSEEFIVRILLKKCPKLMGVDLSGSMRYIDQFDHIPASISELNLSACSWLTSAHLAKASQQFYHLKKLHLNSNVHLNYLAWGELQKFRQLSTLHLKRCHQITDEDLKLISQACPHLIELDLEECRGISDRGIIDVIDGCKRLAILNLNRCYPLTDKTLMELSIKAFNIIHLSLIRCSNFSDKTLLNLVQLRLSLRYLNVMNCHFSPQILKHIRQDFPLLNLVD